MVSYKKTRAIKITRSFATEVHRVCPINASSPEVEVAFLGHTRHGFKRKWKARLTIYITVPSNSLKRGKFIEISLKQYLSEYLITEEGSLQANLGILL